MLLELGVAQLLVAVRIDGGELLKHIRVLVPSCSHLEHLLECEEAIGVGVELGEALLRAVCIDCIKAWIA